MSEKVKLSEKLDHMFRILGSFSNDNGDATGTFPLPLPPSLLKLPSRRLRRNDDDNDDGDDDDDDDADFTPIGAATGNFNAIIRWHKAISDSSEDPRLLLHRCFILLFWLFLPFFQCYCCLFSWMTTKWLDTYSRISFCPWIVYDRHEECPAWSAMGECKKSEWTWMVDNCPRSCEIACEYTIRNTPIAGKKAGEKY